jgi:hypothetical protein
VIFEQFFVVDAVCVLGLHVIIYGKNTVLWFLVL